MTAAATANRGSRGPRGAEPGRTPASDVADEGAETRHAVVTGASSQVGDFLLPLLLEAGFSVTAVSRAAPREPPAPGSTWIKLDITDPAQMAGFRREARILFHLAPLPYLPEILRPFAVQCVRRVIAFGSTSRFTKVSSPDRGEERLASALAEAEELVARECGKHGIAWTVFRPTMIYGGEGSAVAFIERKIRSFGFFPVAGGGTGLRQPVHGQDLALACLRALDAQASFGRGYNLAGGEVLEYREMVRRIFCHMGRKPLILPVPVALLRVAIPALAMFPPFRGLTGAMAERMAQHMCFETADATRDFGFSARPFLAES